MAGENVDSDYAGRPIAPVADEDRTPLPHYDCIRKELDGRMVWLCANGTFEVDPRDGGPDYSREILHRRWPWPTLDEALAAAEREAQ